jgi:hypothetical protein
MNGFHDGIAEKSVRMLQTLLGDALIAICVLMDTVAITPAATGGPIINQMMSGLLSDPHPQRADSAEYFGG